MDIKPQIIRWEHQMEENPGIPILIIVGFLAAVLLIVIFVDALIKKRNDRRRIKGLK